MHYCRQFPESQATLPRQRHGNTAVECLWLAQAKAYAGRGHPHLGYLKAKFMDKKPEGTDI